MQTEHVVAIVGTSVALSIFVPLVIGYFFG